MRLNRLFALGAAALAACAPPATGGIPAPRVGSGASSSPVSVGLAADMVLVNGRIFVADSAGTIVRAMAVRDGKVVAAGSDAEARALAGPGTRIVDLAGRLVTPGFNDAHVHIAEGGGALLEADLTGATSLAEIERRVREAASKAAPGAWIQGRGWDQTRLPAAELGPGGWPTREVLDRAAPANPVVLSRVDGHTSWVNSAALRIAGVTKDTRDPPGGEIVRDPRTGEATGILREGPARGLVTTKVPSPGPAQIRRQIRAAMELAASTGVTSVQTDVSPITSGSFDENDPALPAAFRVFQELEREDSLTFRVYAWVPLTREFIAGFGRLGIRAPYGDPWLRLGMVKGYTDGSLGSRSAYMLTPYSDAPNTRGLPQHSDPGLDSLVDAADAAGLQVILHAIGDAANRQALDAFEHAERANPAHERRHRIEHAQVIAPSDIPRFRQLGVIASMQPTHATSDMRWAEQRIGPERLKGAYAWRSMLNAGATVIFGTDFPVEPIRPVEGVYSAVTRQSRDEPGTPPGGWMPEQRLTREEAIRLYTAAPAFGEWQEKVKGTLRPGMYADFVVWSADLLTIPAAEILKAEPVMTVVGGRVVYEKR
ncbi:MAG TPA: amidohydrolase [Longimicrobium sp.]|nr:amidohydrolase [Longimicrobium sp.]